tara:strand:+ start:4008 stop:4337 length:330 start_codon:yes stop_codon:yes gene_type:complete
MTSITVKKGDKLVFVKLDTVVYFQAKDKYVEVITAKENQLTAQSLVQLEKKLPQNFLRVHKSFVINKNYVKDVQKYFKGRYIISFTDGTKESTTTGRSYGAAVIEWLEN